MTEHGCHDATTDPRTILRWWTDHPDANIGIATGSGSGLVVVDLDLYKVPEALQAFEAEHGKTRTYTVETPRGGQHRYFALGARQTARCTGEEHGVCIKGDGGYVVAPPSKTADGVYSLLDARNPARAPQTICRTTPPKRRMKPADPATTQAPRAGICSERTTSDDSDDSEQFARIVSGCVAPGLHRNNSALFNLVRELKGFELAHGTLSPADKIEAFNRWYLESHHRGVLRNNSSRDDYLAEYLRAWTCAKIAKGESIEPYWERAKAEPLPPEASYFEGEQKRLLVALCYQLHRAARGGVWFLSGRTGAALIFGKDQREARQTTMSQWLRELTGLGILRVAQDSTHKRARRYLYIEQKSVTPGVIEAA